MPLQQKQPTKSLEDRTADVLVAISTMGYLPRYPREECSLKLVARSLAQFIQTVEVNHQHPTDPKWPYALGWINPLDWVVEQVSQTFDYFPAPIKWREVYQTHFGPLDGRYVEDLLAVVGE